MDTTIVLFIAAAVLAVIGFLTRTAYIAILKDLNFLKLESNRHVEEQGKLKGKLELLEQEHRLKYQLIQETTQQEIRNMATKVGELSDIVNTLVRSQLRTETPSRTRRSNT